MSAMTAAHASFVRQPRHARHHARCVARGGAADKKVNLARRAVLVAPNASSPNRASPHVHRTAGRTSTSTHGAVSPTSADVASTSSSGTGTGSFDDVGTVVKKRAKKKSKRELEQERKEKLEMDSDFCRVVTRYDPSVIEKEALSKPLALARRGAKVTSAFAKLYSRKQALQDADARDGTVFWLRCGVATPAHGIPHRPRRTHTTQARSTTMATMTSAALAPVTRKSAPRRVGCVRLLPLRRAAPGSRPSEINQSIRDRSATARSRRRSPRRAPHRTSPSGSHPQAE
jgi:hypothetical protein